MDRIHLKKGHFSSSAASGLTVVKDCSGWGRDSCFCIKDSKTDGCPGQGIHRRLPILRKQFHYLMMGLRKRWHPKKYIEMIVQNREIFLLVYPFENRCSRGVESIS